MAERKLTDENFEKEIAEGVTLVDFFADWCGPCKMLAPVLEKLSHELDGKATVAKLDIDASQRVASQFQITSVPTLILFKDGKEVNRIVGLRNLDALKQFVMTAV